MSEEGWVTIEKAPADSEIPGVLLATEQTPEVPAEVESLRPSPQLMSAGEYAIYKTPSGGWHVSYIPNDADGKMGHFEIPAIAVQMFQRMQDGGGLPNPLEMMKQFMAARNGA